MTDDEMIYCALTILEGRLKQSGWTFNRAEDAKSYLKLQFMDLEHESFRLLMLNNQHELIETTEMFRGTIDGAAVYPREVVKTVLAFNAAAVVLSHNHPSGNCTPSEADKHITHRLKAALELIDVRVLDHIVVGGNKTFSFAENHLL